MASKSDPREASSTTAVPQSHRIYWQQWLMTTTAPTEYSSNTTSATEVAAAAASYHTGPGGGTVDATSLDHPSSPQSYNRQMARRQRQLITSSAAVRIAPNIAKAKDVTTLMRKTLNLTEISSESHGDGFATKEYDNGDDGTNPSHDALVLVGTIHVPEDYVSFEHESIMCQHRNDRKEDDVGIGNHVERTDWKDQTAETCPFHLVKTLHPTDDPLHVHEEMIQCLNVRLERLRKAHPRGGFDSATDVSKVQWFFVPGSASGGPSVIPNCLELEGYSTTMCDDGVDSDEEDGSVHGGKENQIDDSWNATTTAMRRTADDGSGDIGGIKDTESIPLSSLNREEDAFHRQFMYDQIMQSPFASTVNSQMYSSKTKTIKTTKKEEHEWRRYLQISQSHNSNPHSLAGYLLKRSTKDPHVWKKVYCVLTDDYIWYVHALQHPHYHPLHTKVETHDETPNDFAAVHRSTLAVDNTSSLDGEEKILMAHRHGRISLHRALLIEPNADIERSPLYRTPHAFQVVDGKGIAHSFRSTSEHTVQQWIQSISVRLMDEYENSFLAHAQLIVTEESMARSQRWGEIAVNSHVSLCEDKKCEDDPRTPLATSMRKDLQSQILQLGLDVAEYREGCRHIQALLLSGGGSLKNPSSTIAESTSLHASSTTQEMIKEIWEEASVLLGNAMQIASRVHVGAPNDCTNKDVNNNSTSSDERSKSTTAKKHSSRSLQTLCHHVEFQITGKFGQGKSSINSNFASDTMAAHAGFSHRADPPPVDLFDLLLKELFLLAQKR